MKIILDGSVDDALKFQILSLISSFKVKIEFVSSGEAVVSTHSYFVFPALKNAANKVPAIKELRNISGLGLSDAKRFVENGGDLQKAVKEADREDVRLPTLEACREYLNIVNSDVSLQNSLLSLRNL